MIFLISLVDGNGLKLRITPSGGKTWLFNYYRPTDQKRTQIAFGQYPAVSLAQARQQRELARGLLAQGTDPKAERERLARAAQQAQEERTNTLEKVATEWLVVKRSQVSNDHADDIWRSLTSHAFPTLGAMPVADITAPAAIEALKPLAAKGSLETVKRVTQRLNEVMNHAVNNGLIHHNPLSGIGKAFKAPAKRQYPALRPEQISDLMTAPSTASIKRVTRILIEWQLHTLARPTEAAGARWCEIDEAEKLWRIPAERMKGKRPHIVPLSTQALAILSLLHPISGHTNYLFPGDRNMH